MADRRARSAALLLALFAIVAALVAAGWTGATDRAVLAALRLAGKPGVADVPDWAVTLTRALTHGGDFPVRAALATGAAAILFASRRAPAGWALVLAVGGGALLVEVAKALVVRARPDLAWRLAVAHETSFPSGHATGAMVTYPLIALFLGTLGRRGRARIGVAAGVGFALLVGFTRVMLGVHWASDVVAGWLLGGAVACFAARADGSRR